MSDAELIDLHFRLYTFDAATVEAWQRIRARLTPDRERVARAICMEIHETPTLTHSYLPVADAAIAAMGETK